MHEQRPRILFYVQHLLGIGHLKRASLLSDAFIQQGFEVHIALGGMKSPIQFAGATLHQLPAIRADSADFSSLIDDHGKPINSHIKTARQQQLLALFNDLQPQILLIELYPFGRRQFRFELLPLLERANTSPKSTLVVCSVRDILVRKSPDKLHRSLEAAQLINNYFDKLLVHADPSLVRFEDSFPYADAIVSKLIYTGYIGEPAPNIVNAIPRRGVVVSVGGGAVGLKLLNAVIQCKPESLLANQPWLLLTGPNLSDTDFQQVQLAATAAGIKVERFRPDFIDILAKSSLSISQAGYNTVVELLATGTPALVIPFASKGETEQLQRSELLEKRGALSMLQEDLVTPERLIGAINKTVSTSPKRHGLALNGASRSAQVLRQSLQGEH